MSGYRYAIYYTPPPFSALAQFGAGVLGYDCFDGVDVPHQPFDEIEASLLKLITLEPRRYGFHATIVAPFHINHRSESDLIASAEALATRMPPVSVGALSATLINDFIVLIPANDDSDISRFAAVCLQTFDRYRAPLSESERQRRMQVGLTPTQVKLLDRWGYPYVLDEFRFHMTLAGPIPAGPREDLRDRFWREYNARASSVVEIDAISVMRQDDPGARFRVLRRCRLKG